MGAGKPAAQHLIFIRLHRHDAHIVRPCLDGLAHAGHRAGAAHADGNGVHKALVLPGNALHDGRAGDPAVVLRVVIVGKPVHIVPAVRGGGLRRQCPCPGQTAAGRAVPDLCTQPQQVFLPQGRGILRHHQHDGVPGGQAGQRKGGGKGAGGCFNNGLPRGKLLFFNGKGQHPLGKAVPGGAGGAVKIQIRVQMPLQPAGGGIAPQLHNGAGSGKGLVKIRVDRHKGTPFSWDTTLLS